MSYGLQVKLGLARQATVGSWVTDPGSYHGLGFTSEDVGLEKQELIGQNNTGRFSEGATYDGISNVSGTIEMELTPRTILAGVAAVLAHSATTTNSGSIRTWEFLPSTVDFSSTLINAPWTIYKQFTDAQSAECFYDGQFGQLELQLTQGQFLRGRIGLIGSNRVPTGVGSANVISDVGDQGRLFPWNVASISYGGAAVLNFSDVGITYNKQVDALYTINGTLAPFKYTRQGTEQVQVRGTFYMDSRSMLNDFVTGTQRQLLIYLVNTRAAIQSGYFNSILIDIPQLKVTAFKPVANGPGEVAVPFQGRGVIDPSSSYQIKVTLVNTFQTNL